MKRLPLKGFRVLMRGLCDGGRFLVRYLSDEVVEGLAVGDGEQVSVFALHQVGFKVTAALLPCYDGRSLADGCFVFYDDSGTLIRPSFLAFSVASAQVVNQMLIGGFVLFLLIKPEINGFGAEHGNGSGFAGLCYLLRRPESGDEPGDAPDDSRAVGFRATGFVGAAGGEALGVCGLVSVGWSGTEGGVTAQLAADS